MKAIGSHTARHSAAVMTKIFFRRPTRSTMSEETNGRKKTIRGSAPSQPNCALDSPRISPSRVMSGLSTILPYDCVRQEPTMTRLRPRSSGRPVICSGCSSGWSGVGCMGLSKTAPGTAARSFGRKGHVVERVTLPSRSRRINLHKVATLPTRASCGISA